LVVWPMRPLRCRTVDSLNTLKQSTPSVMPKSPNVKSFSMRRSI
jgi:hypothetical protein